MILKKLQVNG
jgi:hypothetical protein